MDRMVLKYLQNVVSKRNQGMSLQRLSTASIGSMQIGGQLRYQRTNRLKSNQNTGRVQMI